MESDHGGGVPPRVEVHPAGELPVSARSVRRINHPGAPACASARAAAYSSGEQPISDAAPAAAASWPACGSQGCATAGSGGTYGALVGGV